jgi:catechol 2,3-dioxygenase-like lactoylglutathione lyase family enzyme
MSILKGFTTISYWADDLEAAANWYAELLGIEPYFRRPAYIEFRVGPDEDELGIVDAAYLPDGWVRGAAGVVMHWAVATPVQPPIERGPGYVTASVLDPFGNVLGVMENVHFDERHGSQAA